MNRLDRYVLAQLVGPFGFFALIFAGIIWLTQALGLVDRVIASNQSALVFLEFSTLILPRVLIMILPLAAFAAGLYAVNRLYGESELVVMMASGQSWFRLLVPFGAFGLLLAGLLYPLTLFLGPVSATRLADRLAGFRSEITNSFVAEGEFVHPSPDVTIFVSDTSREGAMEGLFLHDQREADSPVTYSAKEALLLREGATVRLVMFDGLILASEPGSGAWSSVDFDQFTYDLTDLLPPPAARRRAAREYMVQALLNPDEAMLAEGRPTRGQYLAEAHDKLSLPLLGMIFPALALAVLVSGPFRRGGMGWKIAAATGIAALVQLLSLGVIGQIAKAPGLVPLAYLPATGALALSLGLLWRAGRLRGGRGVA